MESHKKVMAFGALIVILFCFMTGCGQKPSNSQAMTAAELKDIMSNGNIGIGLNLGSKAYVPKNQKAALSKVVTWLKQAEPYKEEIPKPTYGLTTSSPSQEHPMVAMSIFSSDNPMYVSPSAYYIIPATYIKNTKGYYRRCFIKNVIVLYRFVDGPPKYIKSRQLYNYLKSNKWKKDFKLSNS